MFFAKLLVLSVFFVIGSTRPSTSFCGGKPADVVFVLDTSTSIWPLNFDKYVRPFIRNVINMFDVGPSSSQTRVGVVTFSHMHHHQFHLKDHLSREDLDNAVEWIPYTRGRTNTHMALAYVTDTMFAARNGARDNVAHIAVVMTDGRSREKKLTKAESARARAAGVDIFAIGVGDAVEFRELHDIASDPDDNFVFHVRDVKALVRLQNQLAIRTCQVTSLAPTRPTLPSIITTERLIPDQPSGVEICGGKPADVYFLLDASTSVWKKDFNEKVLGFVRDMLNVFDIGPTKTRVGILTFSDRIQQVFQLNTFGSRDQLQEAVNPRIVKYLSGETNTAAAISYVRDRGFARNVARRTAAHIMIVITDGLSYEPELTSAEAEAARKAGIYLFAVGVGPSVDSAELSSIASDPDSQFVFRVENYGALNTVKNLLAIQTCSVKPTERPPKDQAVCNIPESDIIFVFESTTQSKQHKVVTRDAIIKFAKRIESIGSPVRVGVVTDPCPTETDIPFTSLASFQVQMGTIVDRPDKRLNQLMRQMRDTMYKSRHGRRRQVAVVLLDESSHNDRLLLDEARRAHMQGIEVFAVAVGKVNEVVLRGVSSRPYVGHVIKVDNYGILAANGLNLFTRLCRQ